MMTCFFLERREGRNCPPTHRDRCSLPACRSAMRRPCWALWGLPSQWPPTSWRGAPPRASQSSSAWPLPPLRHVTCKGPKSSKCFTLTRMQYLHSVLIMAARPCTRFFSRLFPPPFELLPARPTRTGATVTQNLLFSLAACPCALRCVKYCTLYCASYCTRHSTSDLYCPF